MRFEKRQIYMIWPWVFLLVLFCSTGLQLVVYSQSKSRVTRIAGGLGGGYGGDGGPAVEAPLDGPQGIAFDRSGSLYIADSGNNAIRKVDAKGIITTVTRAHKSAKKSKTKPALNTQLDSPDSLTLDKEGNLYFTQLDQVCKLTPQGKLYRIAGTKKAGYDGDGGPAIKAHLNDPRGIVIDSKGNLYIADSKNNRVRKIDRSGKITTIAGTSKEVTTGDGGPAIRASLKFPSQLAINRQNELYIATLDGVRKIDRQGIITTLPGTHEATLTAIALDNQGNLYIGEMYEGIYRVDIEGRRTLVLREPSHPFAIYPPQRSAGSKTIVNPSALVFDSKGRLYVSDNWAAQIIRLDTL